MADDFQERTEAASPRRRIEARERGQIPLSPEVYAAASLTAAAVAFSTVGRSAAEGLMGMLDSFLRAISSPPSAVVAWVALLRSVAGTTLRLAAPFLTFAVVTAVAAWFLQTRGVWSPRALGWRPEKLNPLPGLKALFGLQGLVRFGIAVLKIGVLGLVVWATLAPRLDRIRSTAGSDFPVFLALLVELLTLLLLRVALAALVIALLDFTYQRWKNERDLKMTKEEAKEEFQRTEGNPTVRGRILERGRELTRGAQVSEVSRATAVITNPIHVAVAIRYVPKEAPAPVVLAKGRGRLAERIVAAATRHNVPVVRREAVARALYRLVPVGGEIPAKLYRVVAEILAHVLQARTRR